MRAGLEREEVRGERRGEKYLNAPDPCECLIAERFRRAPPRDISLLEGIKMCDCILTVTHRGIFGLNQTRKPVVTVSRWQNWSYNALNTLKACQEKLCRIEPSFHLKEKRGVLVDSV